MQNRWFPRTRSEEGEWQINNMLAALAVAIVLAILVGGVGHLFAVSYG